MNKDNLEIFGGITEGCAEALFESQGYANVRCRALSERNPCNEPGLAGIVGFTGEGVSGTVVLAATWQGVRWVLNSQKHAPDPRDWLREMSNQLVGRIKNQLLRYECTVYVTTPISLSGSNLHVGPSDDSTGMAFEVQVQGEPITIWLDIAQADWFQIGEASQDVLTEGDLMLF